MLSTWSDLGKGNSWICLDQKVLHVCGRAGLQLWDELLSRQTNSQASYRTRSQYIGFVYLSGIICFSFNLDPINRCNQSRSAKK